MPTPDIIKVFREKYPNGIVIDTELPDEEGHRTVADIRSNIEADLLQALSDREAEIVAGIEGMEKSDAGVDDDNLCALANVYFYNNALDDIATKITKGEI